MTSFHEALDELRKNDPTAVEAAWKNVPPLTIQDVENLAEAMQGNNTLRILYLTHTGLTDEHVAILARMLKNNTGLEDLTLNGNWIGDDGARALAEALKENRTLKDLYLWSNSIGTEGFQALARILEENRTVTIHAGRTRDEIAIIQEAEQKWPRFKLDEKQVQKARDTFKPEHWIGKTNQMKAAWEKIPNDLKYCIDFTAALNAARVLTLKPAAPPPHLTRRKTGPTP